MDNLPMASGEKATRAVLSADTDAATEERQVARWREMSSVEVASLVAGACRAARAMAMAGLRERFPEASEPELIARYAALTLGDDLARRVYPEWFGPARG